MSLFCTFNTVLARSSVRVKWKYKVDISVANYKVILNDCGWMNVIVRYEDDTFSFTIALSILSVSERKPKCKNCHSHTVLIVSPPSLLKVS